MEEKKLDPNASTSYGSIDPSGEKSDRSDGDPDKPGTKKSLYNRVFPRGIKVDTKAILNLTWPLAVCQLTIFLLGPVSLIYAGHVGTQELAAVGLGISVLSVTGLSIMIGVATACDTLMSNAFGSVNKSLVGVYAQRALYIMPLFCLPCWALHLNSKAILILIGQDPKTAELAEGYLLAFAPGLFFCSVHQVLFKFLVTQNIVLANLVLGVVGNMGNVGLQYLFVFHLKWGVRGCAAGQAFGFFILFSITLSYILISKVYKDTWTGWSWKALEDWGLFFRLAISGIVMVAMEWWVFEFGIFLSGILSNAYLSANSLVFNMENIFYSLPMSFGVAASVRVGQLLGGGDAIGAKNAGRVAQSLALIGFFVEAVIIISLRNYIPYIFTNDKEVRGLVSVILIMLSTVLGLDAIVCVTTGILRGAGRQLVGALGNMFGFFLIALPLACVFMFVFKYGAYGFWYGVIIGVIPVCVLYFVLQARFNWEAEAKKAQRRVGVDEMNKSLMSDIKSGEYNLKDMRMTTRNKAMLLGKRLCVVAGLMSMLAAGLIARFTTSSESAFSSNSTNPANSTFLTTPMIALS